MENVNQRLNRSCQIGMMLAVLIGGIFAWTADAPNGVGKTSGIIMTFAAIAAWLLFGIHLFPKLAAEEMLTHDLRISGRLRWAGIVGAYLCLGLAVIPERFPHDLFGTVKFIVMSAGIMVFLHVQACNFIVEGQQRLRNAYLAGLRADDPRDSAATGQ